jgi:hypothetical protein
MKSKVFRGVLFVALVITPGLILLGVALYNVTGDPKYIEGICLTSTHRSTKRDFPVEIVEFSKVLEITKQQYKVIDFLSTLGSDNQRTISKRSAPRYIAVKHFEQNTYRVPCRDVGGKYE